MIRSQLYIVTLSTIACLCAFAPAMDPVPSLDELLGLEESEQSPDNAAIDQSLSAQQAGEAFTQAVGLMDRAASRIGTDRDAGLTTQRIQEDILRKLDQVIDSAQQNQNSNSGGSSSSSSSNQPQQPNQQSQQSETPTSGSGEPSDGSTPPGSDRVGSNDRSGARAQWGNLPERLRDALSQGLDEPYSNLYRTLTEKYYKALAEDDE